jgi:Family of unknown function (DUF6174)
VTIVRSASRLIIAFAALAMGCSDDPTGPKQSELDAARRVWATNGYTSYQFTIRMDCFCPVTDPIRAVVVNDSLVRATIIATGESVDPHYVRSIKALFDFIGQGIANHAAVLRVTYDPNLGFPREIIYDGAANTADDEINFTVSDVVLGGVLNARN